MDNDQHTARGTRRRRLLLATAAIPVVALGLALHYLASGPAGDLATDALYAVLVYLVLGILIIRARPMLLGLGAFALCAAIEFSQLSGIPATLSESVPPLRLLLGTTFAPLDLLAYAMGVAVVMVVDVLLQRAARAERAR